MNVRINGLGVLGFVMSSHTATAAGSTHIGSATLTCGQARLVARTSSQSHIPPADGFAWTAQTITLQATPDSIPQKLPLPRAQLLSGEGPAIDSVVTSWKCLQGSQQKVILLWFTCSRADLGGVCSGEREWSRFLTTEGKFLDAGYVPQDKRYMRLSTKLGITLEGVQLEDATGE